MNVTIDKNQRALVIVTSLSKDFAGIWRVFYSLTEWAAVAIARLLLGGSYTAIAVRRGSQATKDEFLAALRDAADRPGIEVVDVFLHLHGLPETFCFHDANVSSAALRDEILALGLSKNRLRLFYNTCCYGDSQNDDMLAAGFATAIGSKKVNATGAGEFPIFCVLWRLSQSIQKAVHAADAGLLRRAQDAIARILLPDARGRDVDSRKVVRGQDGICISTFHPDASAVPTGLHRKKGLVTQR